ncbi:MAG TPA: FAD-dependent oxidoreductase [Thermoanaerobaculia bacterium]|nr:FAD-dependent oxidoreductase [Thermoanaerobaculia bacterium]
MQHPLGSPERPLRVAVVGSGPSGFYAIASLFKSGLAVTVDLFDRLPTPFGLVRGGVAPDHQKIKNVIRVYNKTAEIPGFRFFGNVAVGRDLGLDELRRHYHQVVLAVGNESDRRLGIPGEDLAGVHSATEFVGWYNGHPDFQDRSFDLVRARRVAVVGNGNVAMDVTRILAEEPDALHPTDITEESLAELRRSRVEEIVLLGRRGPAEAAFSPPEIKEIGSLEHAELVVAPSEVELDEASRRWLEQAAPSARKNVDYLTEASARPAKGSTRRVVVRFLVSPVELLGDDEGRLRAVRVEHNELVPDPDGTPRPRGTGHFEELAVDLLFKAVGYRGQPLPGVPFDERRGVLPNVEGRVVDPASGAPLPGLYAVGWAKRGPSGLIGTNSADSEATVAKMVEDARAAGSADDAAPDLEAVPALLRERGVDYVSFADWQNLDRDEVARGEALGKCRLKYTSVEAMMDAVRRLRSSSG